MAKFTEVLKNRNFFFLWLGQIISQFGDRLDQMALIGFIYQRAPGSAFELAKLLSFTIIPVFIVGPVAGAYVDRWDRRKTMYICDFLRGFLVLSIPFFFLKLKAVYPLYLVIFLVFSLSRFFVPAKLAIVPDLVKKEQLLLANSLVNTTGMIAAIVGFGLGGILVAVLGVNGGFILDALSFFISAILIFFISVKKISTYKENILETGIKMVEMIRKSVFTEIKEGIIYFLKQKQIRFILNIIFLLWAALGSIYVVSIVFVQESLRSMTADLGLIIMFLGIGLFFGSLVYGRFGAKLSHFKMIFLSLGLGGLVLILFAALLQRFSSFFLAGLLSFIFGTVISPILTASNTLIHIASSEDMRGKVFSSLEVVMHLAFLLFMFIASGLSELVGRMWILIGVGAVFSFLGILGFFKEKLLVR